MIKIEKKDKNKIITSLNNNRLVIIETDTVFGVIAKATKENEIKINEFKKRDITKKVSVIFPNKNMLYSYLYDISYYKKEYMEEKLPGKYTFIVKLRNFSNFTREDFGVRITGNEYLQTIIKEVGPVLASSCNITGNLPLSNSNDIEKEFSTSDIDIVASDKILNSPSTIISLINDIEIIR